MTHLRKIMLEEFERRNYSAGMIRRYLPSADTNSSVSTSFCGLTAIHRSA